MMANSQPATKVKIKPVKPISTVWLIPIVAILLGVWMMYEHWKSQGPVITIEFKKASGIEAGMTKIKSLDVDIGQVTKVDIKPDLDGVIVTARLTSPDYENLLHDGSAFWVVLPQVTRAGITGLHTLLSGPYIELYPGSGEGEQSHFKGLDGPPLTSVGTPGSSVTLKSENDFSFTAGDPILYKGFSVGKIEDIYFNSDENVMYYNAFIEAPYHTLVRTNTRFWKISGIGLDVSANGIKIQTEKLETIIRGGITFGLPENQVLGQVMEGRGYFDIYPNEQMIIDERYEYFVEYVLLVKDSIRGLALGAPVEFHGVKIGKVVQTNVRNQTGTSLLDKDALIPVVIQLEPGRMGLSDDEAGVEKIKTDIKKWVAEGLKASLATGNLVTGSKLVELAYFKQIKPASLTEFQQYSAIPLVPNKYSRIGIEISELINKLNRIPVGSVASKTESVLIETKQTLTKLQKLPLESMVNNADKAFIKADKMVESLTKSATTLEQMLEATEEKNLPKNMDKALRSVNAILLDLKPLILHLKNKPNGLIFSGQKIDEIEPKKGQ